MTRRTLLLTLVVLGVVAGTAMAAFVATTSTVVNTFSTRAVPSRPQITGTRLTTDPSCGVGVPADTVRQANVFYACVGSVTDTLSPISAVTADLSAVLSGPTAGAVPLATTGGPFGSYAYRSAALTANTLLPTGTSGVYDVKAVNALDDSSTLHNLPYNVRSYRGTLLGEFGEPAFTGLVQYYRFAETTATAANAATGGTAAVTYQGTPTRQVAGVLVGNANTAVRLNGTTQYLSAARLTAVRNDFSEEIWVKGSAASGSGPGTLWSDSAGLMDAGSTTSASDHGVGVDATGRIVAGCGNGVTIRSAASALTDGLWHHVVFTRVRTTGALALYLDGQSVATATTCNTTTHTAGIYYGRSHESNRYLAADLDEAAIYSRALTPAEVLDHYKLATGTG